MPNDLRNFDTKKGFPVEELIHRMDEFRKEPFFKNQPTSFQDGFGEAQIMVDDMVATIKMNEEDAKNKTTQRVNNHFWLIITLLLIIAMLGLVVLGLATGS